MATTTELPVSSNGARVGSLSRRSAETTPFHRADQLRATPSVGRSCQTLGVTRIETRLEVAPISPERNGTGAGIVGTVRQTMS
jgi:hypothetical protein